MNKLLSFLLIAFVYTAQAQIITSTDTIAFKSLSAKQGLVTVITADAILELPSYQIVSVNGMSLNKYLIEITKNTYYISTDQLKESKWNTATTPLICAGLSLTTAGVLLIVNGKKPSSGLYYTSMSMLSLAGLLTIYSGAKMVKTFSLLQKRNTQIPSAHVSYGIMQNGPAIRLTF